MKNKLLATLLLLISFPAIAEVTFFNKSHYRSMEVSYQFCHDNNRVCSAVNTVTVPSIAEGKNYVSIMPPPEETVVLIDSAVEKDELGDIIAKGKYSRPQGSCGVSFRDINETYNGAILLDDIEGSPIITCGSSIY